MKYYIMADRGTFPFDIIDDATTKIMAMRKMADHKQIGEYSNYKLFVFDHAQLLRHYLFESK